MAQKEINKLICLVHFNPLELFPPVMNAIIVLAAELPNFKIVVNTTSAANLPHEFSSRLTNIKIVRMGTTGSSLHWSKRLFNYCIFNLAVFYTAFFRRPSSIIYFETISSFIPVLYKRLFPGSVKLFIHYHEYMTPEEYKQGMWLVRVFHKREKKVYEQATWVSHTNEKRMELFLKDECIQAKNKYILPNYPPLNWKSNIDCRTSISDKKVIHVIYVGTLNLDSLYLREFSEWVIDQHGEIEWDIYSLNITEEITNYFNNLNCSYIKLKGSVPYFELNNLFVRYDVGVILYKGSSPNWVYVAPNKLFEYHVCGLDVWMPREIVTSLKYVTTGTYPQIRALDFSRMNEYSVHHLFERKGLTYKLNNFSCEEALILLVKMIK